VPPAPDLVRPDAPEPAGNRSSRLDRRPAVATRPLRVISALLPFDRTVD
jgi:hypothetical protein